MSKRHPNESTRASLVPINNKPAPTAIVPAAAPGTTVDRPAVTTAAAVAAAEFWRNTTSSTTTTAEFWRYSWRLPQHGINSPATNSHKQHHSYGDVIVHSNPSIIHIHSIPQDSNN